ncbi:MAG TPA: class I SAM-dependent methyltransferase [Nitrospira sp.]|nr:class I SAM-dependent methyltransferase [Nitrospira sp.]
MIDYEAPSYHVQRHPEFLADEELRHAWSCFADRRYFEGVPEGARVLEYGGGLGNNLLAVARRADTWMIEPSELGRHLAAGSGIAVARGIEELCQRDFDAVLCRHVLEHLEDPFLTLRRILDLLKPGGELIVAVPCENMRLFPSEEDLDHHLYCWSPRTLGNLIQRAGYRVGRIYFEYYAGKRRLLPLYRFLGGNVYAGAVRAAGRLFNCKELVIRARKAVTRAGETESV